MGIISFFIVWVVLIKMIAEYESPSKKFDEYDKDPNCPTKSNKWFKEHPEAKEIGVMEYYKKYGNK